MKIISIACLVGLIGLSGCTTTANKMASWVGRPEADLLSSWGAPDSSANLPNGTKIYTWKQPWQDANGGFHQGRATFTVDANGNVVNWSYQNLPGLQWK